eukprot:GFYU01019355.1.p1 GENE.GFYU01019355.1~~GFYU01019355.1.p1  ORF type:complete len:423 (-),score=63.09 GFYU01019355.1:136-1404(-)
MSARSLVSPREPTKADQGILRAAFAELVGSILVVFVGATSSSSSSDVVSISFAFGLSYMMVMLAFGHVSGGHANPIVTFSIFLMRKITIKRLFSYFVAQLIGALIGGGLAKAAIGDTNTGNLGATVLGGGTQVGGAVVFEIMMALFLILVFLQVSENSRTRSITPIAVGLTVAACNMAAYNRTGCGLNPTRSFAGAIVSGKWHDHIIYWVCPYVGSALACFLHVFSLGPKHDPVKSHHDVERGIKSPSTRHSGKSRQASSPHDTPNWDRTEMQALTKASAPPPTSVPTLTLRSHSPPPTVPATRGATDPPAAMSGAIPSPESGRTSPKRPQSSSAKPSTSQHGAPAAPRPASAAVSQAAASPSSSSGPAKSWEEEKQEKLAQMLGYTLSSPRGSGETPRDASPRSSSPRGRTSPRGNSSPRY